jgi:hypothetical protein
MAGGEYASKQARAAAAWTPFLVGQKEAPYQGRTCASMHDSAAVVSRCVCVCLAATRQTAQPELLGGTHKCQWLLLS